MRYFCGVTFSASQKLVYVDSNLCSSVPSMADLETVNVQTISHCVYLFLSFIIINLLLLSLSLTGRSIDLGWVSHTDIPREILYSESKSEYYCINGVNAFYRPVLTAPPHLPKSLCCQIKVNVTVGLQRFTTFTTIQTVRSYNSTLVQARKLLLSMYVHLILLFKT